MKSRKLLSDQVLEQLRQQFAEQGLIDENGEISDKKAAQQFVAGSLMADGVDIDDIEVEEKPQKAEKPKKQETVAGTGNQATDSEKRVNKYQGKPQPMADAGSTGSDEVLEISS